MPYLKKLSVIEVPPGSGFWSDLFPEFNESINSFQLKRYREIWLLELEKLLRRLRVVSLKMDRASDSWIKKIRNFTEKKHQLDSTPVVPETREPLALRKEGQSKIAPKAEDLKKEEQRLIIEIAKNPKNGSLYEILGDLYVKMENFTDAKESYEAAIELNPDKEELKKKHSQATEKVL